MELIRFQICKYEFYPFTGNNVAQDYLVVWEIACRALIAVDRVFLIVETIDSPVILDICTAGAVQISKISQFVNL